MSEFNDLLHSIREIALEHEEPYKDGSWEAFVKTNRKKRKIFIWSYIVSSLAASLIIGFLFVSQIFTKKNTNDNLSNKIVTIADTSKIINQAKAKKIKKEDKRKKTVFKETKNGNIRYEKETIHSLTQNKINNESKKKENPDKKSPVSQERKTRKQISENNNSDVTFPTDSIKDINHHYELSNNKIIDFETEISKENKERRINLGFLISPLLTSNENSNNLGVSIGAQTDMPLSRIVSVNSGLTFSLQKINHVYKDQTSANEPVSNTSRLISFDIPINFKITLNKRKNKESYLLAGISSIGYLRENNTYIYKYEEVIEVTTVSEGQEKTTYQTIVKETSVENNVPALSTFDFAGFMNISYGLKSSFSKNIQLTIAPYVKLPLRGLTANNLRYTNAGISLIFSK